MCTFTLLCNQNILDYDVDCILVGFKDDENMPV